MGRQVLVVTPSTPAVGRSGFDARVHQLSRHLASRHAVTILCHATDADGAAVAALRAVVDTVRTVCPGRQAAGSKRIAQLLSVASTTSYEWRRLRSVAMQAELDRLLERSHFDIVQLESSQLGGLAVPWRCACVLDAHNIEYELRERMWRGERSVLRRTYSGLEAAKLRREETRLWARLSGCALTSEREESIVRRLVPELPTRVVANGVDLDYYRPVPHVHRPSATVVFTGTMNYRPNTDGAIHLARDILPLVLDKHPDARVSICGQDPPPVVVALAGARVAVTGRVDDMRTHLASAAAVAVPLRMGSGTRLKILEALAMGRPVVTTSLGCEGLDVRHGEHVLIADGASAFAAAVGRVLADRTLAAALGRNGRSLVERRYSWNTAAAQLDDLHTEVVARRAAAERCTAAS